MRFFFALFLAACFPLFLSGQIPDSVGFVPPPTPLLVDSSEVLVEVDSTKFDSLGQRKGVVGFFKNDYPNPKKALAFSLVLPGAGQVYNKKPWKLVFVYGALAGLGYLVDYNTDIYLDFKVAYRREVRGLPHKYSDLNGYSASTLKSFRDKADKNRQLSYVGFFAVYALNGVEAFVDAHLSTFDVGDDLTLKLEPSFEPTPYGQPSVGLGLQFQLYPTKKPPSP